MLIKINYGQIGDQTGLFYTTNPDYYGITHFLSLIHKKVAGSRVKCRRRISAATGFKWKPCVVKPYVYPGDVKPYVCLGEVKPYVFPSEVKP